MVSAVSEGLPALEMVMLTAVLIVLLAVHGLLQALQRAP